MANDFDERLDGEEAAWFLEAGLPSDLLEYAAFQTWMGHPCLTIADWFDVSVHRELIQSLARKGCGFTVYPGLEFDLSVFGEQLGHLPSLQLIGGEADFRSLDRLPLAENLVVLRTPLLVTPVDLSGMVLLEAAFLRGPGAMSAVSAPKLRLLDIEHVDTIDGSITIAPGIEMLSVAAETVDLAGLVDQAPQMRSLSVARSLRVDLSPLRHVPLLEGLLVRDARHVDLAPLRFVPRLSVLHNGNAFYPAGTALDPVSFRLPLGAEVPCTTATGALASTGDEMGDGMLWAGALLVVLGAAFVAVRRRQALPHD